MIEIVPASVDSAFLYFHTRCSSGDEIAPFLDDLRTALPSTYIWAGDGGIDGAEHPMVGRATSYGTGPTRYWFVFPMHGGSQEDFARAVEAMGAVLLTCGGYVNSIVGQIAARFRIGTSRIVLCGHQHGGCVALATAMMRRKDPFALTVLFDPWPLEAYYLQSEQRLPPTRVVCVDNPWVKERERQRCADEELCKVFRRYGINAEGVTLAAGGDKPDEHMFREAIRQIESFLV